LGEKVSCKTGSKRGGREAYSIVVFGLLFALGGILIYSNTLQSPFLLDDFLNIPQNPHIRIEALSLKNIVAAGFKSCASSRPMANISFALNYDFRKYEVRGYHIVNIAIHILTAMFIYLFVRVTLLSPVVKDKYKDANLIAFFAALLWLVHPVQAQTVTYIVQRMTSMAAMFYVLSFLLYVKGRFAVFAGKRSWVWFTGCILAWMMALGSKEIAATLPVFILLYEWYFFQDLSTSWLKSNVRYIAGVVVIFCLLGLVYLGKNPLERITGEYTHRDFTITERLLTQFRVIIYYISLLVFPHPSRLNLDHYFAISHSLFDPVTTLLCLAVTVGFAGLAVYLAKGQRLLSFCILWFFGNLVIESSVLGLELVFEHRLYLPSIFVFVVAVVLAYRFIKPAWVRVTTLCIVAVLFGVWTYQRNSVYVDAITLWQDCVNKSPQKYRPQVNLGTALKDAGKVTEAIEHFNKALELKGEPSEIYNNLGNAYDKLGRIEDSIRYYRKALVLDPNLAVAHYNLAVALAKQGKTDEAIAEYRQALRLEPENSDALGNLGFALAGQGNFGEAIECYKKALTLEHDNVITHGRLGLALAGAGKTNEAIREFRIVLSARPNDAEMHRNLGILLEQKGETAEAIKSYRAALQIDPNAANVRQLLENALQKQKNQP
jgi:Flp pilus assembly protein TadD